jgi:hypothetical protein
LLATRLFANGVELSTVKVAGELVTVPCDPVTTTVKIVPDCPIVVADVVYVLEVAPETAVPFANHW